MDAIVASGLAAVALVVSFLVDRGIALRRFLALLPSFLTMVAAVALVLAVVPEASIARSLGSDNRWLATIAGALAGSVALMPGFVGFPLAGILLGRGVGVMAIAAFTTTLMMVGVLTYPIERRVLGHRVTLLRNALSFVVALIVALAMGVYFGEFP